MAKVTFYKQKRVDEAVRTGIYVGDYPVLEKFEGGTNISDPALLWFVDVRCEGDLPTEPEAARDWLVRNAERICQGLRDLAERLRAGMDVDSWPVLQNLSGAPDGTQICVACSAVRRFDALAIASLLRATADQLVDSLRSLEPLPVGGRE